MNCFWLFGGSLKIIGYNTENGSLLNFVVISTSARGEISNYNEWISPLSAMGIATREMTTYLISHCNLFLDLKRRSVLQQGWHPYSFLNRGMPSFSIFRLFPTFL